MSIQLLIEAAGRFKTATTLPPKALSSFHHLDAFTMSSETGGTGKAGIIVAPDDAPPLDKLVSWGESTWHSTLLTWEQN